MPRVRYDEAVQVAAETMTGLGAGDPADPATVCGPLISAAQRDSVKSYVDSADVAFRGTAPTGKGFWFPPTVLLAHGTDDVHWREEVFGPVVSVMTCRSLDEAIAIHNGVPQGLSSAVFTSDVLEA